MSTESPELEAVATRWLDALRRKDRGALANLFETSEQVRDLGTAIIGDNGGWIVKTRGDESSAWQAA